MAWREYFDHHDITPTEPGFAPDFPLGDVVKVDLIGHREQSMPFVVQGSAGVPRCVRPNTMNDDRVGVAGRQTPRRPTSTEHKGQTVGRVARDLDLTESALRTWVERARADQGQRNGSRLCRRCRQIFNDPQ